jgi:hypothetical protein
VLTERKGEREGRRQEKEGEREESKKERRRNITGVLLKKEL